jgi:carbon monoxide dehydrogenase subunit G
MEKTIAIKAPPEKIWEMLAFDRMPEYMDVAETESAKYISDVHTPEDKYRVGASAHMIEKHGEYDVEITESLKNEEMTFRLKPSSERFGVFKFNSTFILNPVEEGTKLTVVYDLELSWGILGKALFKLWQGKEEKMIERSMEKLKSILEK